MNEYFFTTKERQELIDWFADYPESRIWIRDIKDGLSLTGYLTNTDAPLEKLRLKTETNYLTQANWHTWEGLDDPENDPDPQQYRVFRWWPRLRGYGFRVDLSFSELVKLGARRQSLCVQITDPEGAPICNGTQACYLPMADLRGHMSAPQPPSNLMMRVMGGDAPAEWHLSGYTDLRVFDDTVMETLGNRLSALGPVLEWGSGCGRLSRHLINGGFSVTGIDIDEEAVEWCNNNLSRQLPNPARFLACGLFPPTKLASESFGLAIGISVITHLDEAAGEVWLAELARLLRPGGILLLTTHGFDTFSAVNDARIYRALRKCGYFSVRSGHLDVFLGDQQSYYRETWHSWDYIRERWSRWFSVLDIRRGGHFGYQDLVILQRSASV